ncbi:monovalent cation/H+ antiporter subunit D family protein [Phytoactinopolyspora alkaliphila]|uniref:Monovalent cation/H+ antiporter subunit D family protein n=1 Tax=Phytoactinopolyspora alkaliphila TaxID=1783498 RepID=A0A6N9YL95_9ACTN|nr:monovalent cation/H+ antiporter subunit D family protein [Phytoactinopolyspora alkaliphila]NED95806.1 monovalent cation/H+ antiporter subunit D family protein [Phytoactinopolyspora alkaliphila]
MNNLLPFVVALPLLAAAATPLTRESKGLSRTLLLGTPALVLAFGILLVIETRDGDVLVEQVAGWEAGIAIAFAADLFSALVLVVMSLLTLVCSTFVVAAGDDDDPLMAPLVLVLSGGVFGALLTTDLFNLFVMIEVALIPSYVLMSKSGRPASLAAGRVYLTVNLFGSSLLLGGIALVYAVNGSVNLAELAGAGQASGIAAFAGGIILLALALKGALVPLHGWLPRTYPHASPAVTALFSGLLTKIGIYGLFRVFSVYFEGASQVQSIILAVTVVTMVVGVFGALGENSMRAILAFHMVSQVGYIALGLGFFGVAGMAASIFYLLHHTIVKASLFLSAGAIETHYGTDRLDRLGGLARREPLLAAAFLAAALSLAGIPPFSGFFAKFTLIRASMDAGEYLAAGVAVAVSLFTLLSMLKIWNSTFWGPDVPAGTADMAINDASKGGAMTTTRTRIRRTLIIPGVVLALVTVSLGVGAEILLSLVETAAEGLVDTTRYVEAVIGR